MTIIGSGISTKGRSSTVKSVKKVKKVQRMPVNVDVNFSHTYNKIPKPKMDELQEAFLIRCQSFFRSKGEDNMNTIKQCSIIWEKNKGKMDDERRRNLIKEQRRMAIGAGVKGKSAGGSNGRKSQSMVQPVNTNRKDRPRSKSGKPRILFLIDVKGWAWDIKTDYIGRHLADDFEVDKFYVLEGRRRITVNDIPKRYDLYFTYGWSYIHLLKRIDNNRRITGVTAHRDSGTIKTQMKKARWLHANSILLYNQLKNLGFNDVFYVPNGVDEELFHEINPIPEDRSNILVGHIGKNNVHKNQDSIIIPAIEKAGADKFLHMNDYRDKVPFNEMYKKYQDMDVFIVASDEDGTPNPALEAAACGRPIISNHIGNMPEFIKDGKNGFLVDKEINAYVEKINWLRDNRDVMIEMGQEARKTVERGWTWTIQSNNYRSMFKEILGI